MNIPFNKPFIVGNELEYIKLAVTRGHISGNGYYTKKCEKWLKELTGCTKSLLTHSCTAALEMTAILLNIMPGDEIIMPSYTFVSTASAFVLRKGVPVFIDIKPGTMNMDETAIEHAISENTRAIVAVHYAGVACEMDTIMEIANRYGLPVVEDAAQAVLCSYKNRPLGSIGQLGALSFHETKNITSGEGGALLINDPAFIERAEIIREKGTDRSKYYRGEVDKYSWVDIGSSYLPSDIVAAFLYAQMEKADTITDKKKMLWQIYYDSLKHLEEGGLIELPFVPDYCVHNAHMFYFKASNRKERALLIDYLRGYGVQSVFHYVPLHSSTAGLKCSRFSGADRYTTRESERILRLPLYPELNTGEVENIASLISRFYLKACRSNCGVFQQL